MPIAANIAADLITNPLSLAGMINMRPSHHATMPIMPLDRRTIRHRRTVMADGRKWFCCQSVMARSSTLAHAANEVASAMDTKPRIGKSKRLSAIFAATDIIEYHIGVRISSRAKNAGWKTFSKTYAGSPLEKAESAEAVIWVSRAVNWP